MRVPLWPKLILKRTLSERTIGGNLPSDVKLSKHSANKLDAKFQGISVMLRDFLRGIHAKSVMLTQIPQCSIGL